MNESNFWANFLKMREFITYKTLIISNLYFYKIVQIVKNIIW